MLKEYDFCIVGAGLAGLHLALELEKTGATIAILDPKGIGSGASGTPLGLANPATGRFATRTWEAEKCMDSLVYWLDHIQSKTKTRFFRNSGILRPALDHKIAERMKLNTYSEVWQPDWVEWVDEHQTKEIHPGIQCVEGSVWVKQGLTVEIPTYLENAFSTLFNLNTVDFYQNSFTTNKEDNWIINFGNSDSIKSEKIVFTAGISSIESVYWSDLPFHAVKGQIAILESKFPISFDHSVSALGYIGRLSNTYFAVGSTYEHKFEHLDTDAKGLTYLMDRLKRVLPVLASNSSVVSQWSGVRASTPNRKPILGSHPKEENCYIFAGLGSKGLLYSAYLGKQMKEFLISETELPSEMSINRFYK